MLNICLEFFQPVLFLLLRMLCLAQQPSFKIASFVLLIHIFSVLGMQNLPFSCQSGLSNTLPEQYMLSLTSAAFQNLKVSLQCCRLIYKTWRNCAGSDLQPPLMTSFLHYERCHAISQSRKISIFLCSFKVYKQQCPGPTQQCILKVYCLYYYLGNSILLCNLT